MLNVVDFQRMKQKKEKITMITAYDYPSAKHVEESGTDIILVGDSLGMVVLGYSSTTQVTLTDMIHHAKAVRRGAKETFIVVDMPFMSYHASLEQSIINATKLFQETDAQAIKLEGASEETLALIKQVTAGGIPVVGHLGLTPQTVNVLGGYRVQANDEEASQKLLEDTKRLEEAGAVAIVLECIPKEIGQVVTDELHIPTIGIGAGADCDGQVLVYHDLLQYGVGKLPKFVKTYANFNLYGTQALQNYVKDVQTGQFPQEDHTYTMKRKSILPKA
ncbi:3-methyl-2-oxobutanoate hydroxymethyltransferase [Pseudogracilibacillus auburnensis]|uniref:3-methyl-2-oxobutanoate hydroxymethyltransferase n=1 Tax=Pseudogracilibacillus auburnensis TaxID=1494959 RepID=A0A2V3W3A4_9BACI|nr:3-methyl-2-oxobutanoate hydroxymethyltransferase [Pseudogracilibacillus auburnensis]MBO1003028.1 3-methyl-2-oxobutanoate hydroxymethyltransferase [Pseudogracilibacillus auburnensis]PXW88767.1 ketopantoate hydroxymethyltransferase [Pseudogracilibacillus auburnensis]